MIRTLVDLPLLFVDNLEFLNVLNDFVGERFVEISGIISIGGRGKRDDARISRYFLLFLLGLDTREHEGNEYIFRETQTMCTDNL